MFSFDYQTNNLFFIPPELSSCPFNSTLFIMNKLQVNEVDGPVIIYSLPGKNTDWTDWASKLTLEGEEVVSGNIYKYKIKKSKTIDVIVKIYFTSVKLCNDYKDIKKRKSDIRYKSVKVALAKKIQKSTIHRRQKIKM